MAASHPGTHSRRDIWVTLYVNTFAEAPSRGRSESSSLAGGTFGLALSEDILAEQTNSKSRCAPRGQPLAGRQASGYRCWRRGPFACRSTQRPSNLSCSARAHAQSRGDRDSRHPSRTDCPGAAGAGDTRELGVYRGTRTEV